MKQWLAAGMVGLCSAPVPAVDDPALMQRGEALVSGRCFLCHGPTGESSSPLYPQLAGQSEAYLLQQLRNFKSLAHDSKDMGKVVADMDDNDMQAAAHYFSRQQPTAGEAACAGWSAGAPSAWRPGGRC